MRVVVFLASLSALSGLVTGCSRAGKEDIPLTAGQTYVLQSSGKLAVSAAEGGPGSQPLQSLKVKRKNAGAEAKTPGCWACTDCICNAGECACTECTSC